MRSFIAIACAAASLFCSQISWAREISCKASAAQYHLASFPNVTATMGIRKSKPADGPASDLYLKVNDGSEVLWFYLDFGSAKGLTSLQSSDAPLDGPQVPNGIAGPIFRQVFVHFFDSNFAAMNDNLTSVSSAPSYFFISDTDWPKLVGEAAEQREFPPKLGRALFIFTGCRQ
jgi:hypothetical protein